MIRYIACTSVALTLLGGCNFSPSRPSCVVGQGGWFAKYTLMANQPTDSCSQLRGEGLGVRKYFPPGQNPQLAIRADTLGNMALQVPGDPDPSHSPTSIGPLNQDAPDADNLCAVSSLSRAEQNVGGLDISYEWRDAKFVVQSNVPGTQMSATLRYTDPNCTAEYKAVAMQPNADCFAVDSQGNPVLDPAGNQIPDASRCGPGFFPQGQVNPDFAVTCDPVLFKCVLATDPPSLAGR
jgi:hypothetical protein